MTIETLVSLCLVTHNPPQNKIVKTYTWRGAKIQQDFALFQESILLVQLNQLEGGTSTVAFFFGKFVPLVQTAFAVLFLNRHGVGCSDNRRENGMRLAGTLEQSRNFVGKLRR